MKDGHGWENKSPRQTMDRAFSGFPIRARLLIKREGVFVIGVTDTAYPKYIHYIMIVPFPNLPLYIYSFFYAISCIYKLNFFLFKSRSGSFILISKTLTGPFYCRRVCSIRSTCANLASAGTVPVHGCQVNENKLV